MKKQIRLKGFTIIEVVLVLAIAGLIFLMVFVALPTLQRNQRDSQRREDVSRFIAQLNSYATNNNGAIPTNLPALTSFKSSYLQWSSVPATSEFNDPQSGNPYNITYVNGADSAEPGASEIKYYYGASCSGEGVIASTSTRSAAVRIKLEGSGVFCQDNQ
jgi:prepilin-type N-terminal cleavage/methylation domain-containing protein